MIVRVSSKFENSSKNIAGVAQFFLERGGLYMVSSLIDEVPWIMSRSIYSIDENGKLLFHRTLKPFRRKMPTPPPALFIRGAL